MYASEAPFLCETGTSLWSSTGCIFSKNGCLMKNVTEIVSKIPLFEGLPQDQLEGLARIVLEKRCEKGEPIFFEGDRANGFYVVVKGQVKVFKLSMEGKEQILHIFGPGEPFGEVPVFAGQDFPAHAEAIATSRLFFFPRDAFTDLIAKIPSLALNMLAVLSRRLRQFTVQVEHLSLKEVPGRLAVYLSYLSNEKDGAVMVDLAIAKGQLASLLGTIPETLSRILAKMTKKGLIRVEGHRIEILDREALETLATGGERLT
jgi:CRP/FNR family transcriptional regulator